MGWGGPGKQFAWRGGAFGPAVEMLDGSALAAEVTVRPNREPATNNRQTYFVSSQAMGRKRLFQVKRWADLFVETLIHYRDEQALQLHCFVLMPDHFHAIITPHDSLEKAMQY